MRTLFSPVSCILHIAEFCTIDDYISIVSQADAGFYVPICSDKMCLSSINHATDFLGNYISDITCLQKWIKLSKTVK